MSSKIALAALLSCLLCLVGQRVAAEPVLVARPGLCILKTLEQTQCLMALDLTWQAERASDFCLYHSLTPEPLQCWAGVVRGDHHTQLASEGDVSYWLQRPPQSDQLASITVRVLSPSKRGTQRRRRRHPWSVL